jgi:choline dehydrogenase-like flavoprotein
VVSCGNAVRSLEKELAGLGINLKQEFLEAEKDLGVKRVPQSHIGKGTRKIMRAANKLGFKMVAMPKLIDFQKCISCGNCILGCRRDAKWTALRYLEEAKNNGACLLTGIEVTKVLISGGKAVGIEGIDRSGKKIRMRAKRVVLAAGAIATPVILENSGIKAGQRLFLDLFNVTIGLTKNAGLMRELTMGAVHHHRGFILSPFIDNPFALAATISLPLRRDIKLIAHRNQMLGIMVKIQDDSLGKVRKDGIIEKTVSARDFSRLKKGSDIAKKILIKAGVSPKTIVTTKIRGAHPGATAAIGEVVNKNLETRIKGLFVADSSVLPVAPGLPPIVTIVALAKRLGKYL